MTDSAAITIVPSGVRFHYDGDDEKLTAAIRNRKGKETPSQRWLVLERTYDASIQSLKSIKGLGQDEATTTLLKETLDKLGKQLEEGPKLKAEFTEIQNRYKQSIIGKYGQRSVRVLTIVTVLAWVCNLISSCLYATYEYQEDSDIGISAYATNIVYLVLTATAFIVSEIYSRKKKGYQEISALNKKETSHVKTLREFLVALQRLVLSKQVADFKQCLRHILDLPKNEERLREHMFSLLAKLPIPDSPISIQISEIDELCLQVHSGSLRDSPTLTERTLSNLQSPDSNFHKDVKDSKDGKEHKREGAEKGIQFSNSSSNDFVRDKENIQDRCRNVFAKLADDHHLTLEFIDRNGWRFYQDGQITPTPI